MAILVGRRVHLRPVIILALHTGMRWRDLVSPLESDRLRTWPNPRAENQERSRPFIPMNSIVRETLAAIRRQAESDQVFPIDDVKRSFTYACDKAKLADFRFHDLRHTAATRLADRGSDAFQIAAILGHSSIQMTARYTHATSDGLRRAMESLAVNDKQVGKISPTISPQFATREQEANGQTVGQIRLAS